ncbi:MAG: bifunctional glutamate N-acetyltransferase/amino-acid acetyltransferase ArgJ [Myxococcota bacterium]
MSNAPPPAATPADPESRRLDGRTLHPRAARAEDLGAVAGFRWSGMAAGIKAGDVPDLGLLVCDTPSVAAAVATANEVKAAPLVLMLERLGEAAPRAVLVNSGNANAATGKAGRRAAKASTKAVAKALGVPVATVLPASTGVIGVPLPVEPIAQAAPALGGALDPAGAGAFARAILTTDLGTKAAASSFGSGKRRHRVVGIAKGAGMIHPNLATTLAFVVTDAPLKKGFLRKTLKAAANETFNRITVDGDTSTNDVILALASGAGGGEKIGGDDAASRRFARALREVLEALALQVVADGEGAEHVAKVRVERAPNVKAALAVARTVATSNLVKTAMHGCDPNWGRILGAAGRAGVPFDPEKAEVRVGDIVLYRRGETAMTPEIEAAASEAMRAPLYDIVVRLGAGKAKAHYWTCDLGHEYVRINADYRS